MSAIEVLDLFSAAAGGWSLGLHRAGFTTTAACEVEAWRRALYSENNPSVKVYDDVRTLTADRLLADLGRLPSVVVGSPPCQDISSANTKGKGVEGERSGLYFEAVRIIGEVRPRWFALENSSNLRTRGADAVLAALEALGYACWAVVVRAGDIDANHARPRAWIIGCDLEQVADADRQLPDEWAIQPGAQSKGRHLSGNGAADRDRERAAGAGQVPRRYGRLGEACHAEEDGCGPGLQGRRAEPAERICEQTCWDAPDAPGEGHAGRGAIRSGREARDQHAGNHDTSSTGALGGGDAPDADQAGQADGCVEPGLRQAEIADDGRGVGRSDDGSIAGQMGVRAADRSAALGHRADWSLADLADHLRLDDGLSARLAGHRVDIGDGKGQSAASLIVEAFGDAVIPQIPEAIGRAILRTERALAEIYGRSEAA